MKNLFLNFSPTHPRARQAWKTRADELKLSSTFSLLLFPFFLQSAGLVFDRNYPSLICKGRIIWGIFTDVIVLPNSRLRHSRKHQKNFNGMKNYIWAKDETFFISSTSFHFFILFWDALRLSFLHFHLQSGKTGCGSLGGGKSTGKVFQVFEHFNEIKYEKKIHQDVLDDTSTLKPQPGIFLNFPKLSSFLDFHILFFILWSCRRHQQNFEFDWRDFFSSR